MDAVPYFFQILANGLHSGLLYGLLAYGYVVAHMVTGRANLGHGALFALAGQVFVPAVAMAYGVMIWTLPASLVFGVVVAILISVAAIYVLAEVIAPRLVLRNPNMMIVATLSYAIVLMELARLGADTRDYWLPPLLGAPFYLGIHADAARITQMQGVNLAVGALAVLLFEALVMRGRFGLALRGVADDHVLRLCLVSTQVVFQPLRSGQVLALRFWLVFWRCCILAICRLGQDLFLA